MMNVSMKEYLQQSPLEESLVLSVTAHWHSSQHDSGQPGKARPTKTNPCTHLSNTPLKRSHHRQMPYTNGRTSQPEYARKRNDR